MKIIRHKSIRMNDAWEESEDISTIHANHRKNTSVSNKTLKQMVFTANCNGTRTRCGVEEMTRFMC